MLMDEEQVLRDWGNFWVGLAIINISTVANRHCKGTFGDAEAVCPTSCFIDTILQIDVGAQLLDTDLAVVFFQ